MREAILALDEKAWTPAINADRQPRDSARVTELTDQANLDGWPEGTRLICRRERPHPGAQLAFTDLDGHRFQCFITDKTARTSRRWKPTIASTPRSKTASRA